MYLMFIPESYIQGLMELNLVMVSEGGDFECDLIDWVARAALLTGLW